MRREGEGEKKGGKEEKEGGRERGSIHVHVRMYVPYKIFFQKTMRM